MKRKKTSIIHQSVKSTNQCVTAAKSANKTLGMISRTSVNICGRSHYAEIIPVIDQAAKTRILCAGMEAVFEER